MSGSNNFIFFRRNRPSRSRQIDDASLDESSCSTDVDEFLQEAGCGNLGLGHNLFLQGDREPSLGLNRSFAFVSPIFSSRPRGPVIYLTRGHSDLCWI